MQIHSGAIGIVLLVALVVIPPQDYPKIARTLGRYWAKITRKIQTVRTEFEKLQ